MPYHPLNDTLAAASLPKDHPHAIRIKLPPPIPDPSANRSLTRRPSFIAKLRAKISRRDLRHPSHYDDDAESIGRRESSSVYSRRPSDKYPTDPPTSSTTTISSLSLLSLDGTAPPPPPTQQPRLRRPALSPTTGDDQLMTLAIQTHEKQKALFRSASKHAFAASALATSPTTTTTTLPTAESTQASSSVDQTVHPDVLDPCSSSAGRGEDIGVSVDATPLPPAESLLPRKKGTGIFTDLQAWTRFPSHTRAERCASAGPRDAMSTRDFAVEVVIKESDVETPPGGIRRMMSRREVEGSKPDDSEPEPEDERNDRPLPLKTLPPFHLLRRRPLKSRRSPTTTATTTTTSENPPHRPTNGTSSSSPNKPLLLTRWTRHYTSLLTSSTTFRGANRRTSVSPATGRLAHPELEMVSVLPEGAAANGGSPRRGEFLRGLDEGLGLGLELADWDVHRDGGRGESRREGLEKEEGWGPAGGMLSPGRRTWRGESVFAPRREDGGAEHCNRGRLDNDNDDDGVDEPPGVGEVIDGEREREMLGVGPGQLDGEAPSWDGHGEMRDARPGAGKGAEDHAG